MNSTSERYTANTVHDDAYRMLPPPRSRRRHRCVRREHQLDLWHTQFDDRELGDDVFGAGERVAVDLADPVAEHHPLARVEMQFVQRNDGVVRRARQHGD